MRRAALLLTLVAGACTSHPAGDGSCTPETCHYEPACGDGFCSPEESWQSCPGDCPRDTANRESCNGADDDGDQQVDEGDPGGGAACNTPYQGVCGAGVIHCVSGSLTCVGGLSAAAPEACNGKDDDCDGVVDEDNPGGGGTCDTGESGACSSGVLTCSGGHLGCVGPPPRPEAGPCNGIDDDCNGVVDDGCSSDAPQIFFPRVSAYTGSFRAPAKALSLRPVFSWATTDGADRYQIQIDDSCPPGKVLTCTFPSPELDQTVSPGAEKGFSPDSDLAVSTKAPVGRFYAWRVRACTGTKCTSWTLPRGLHVGQLPNDYDGDGYADALLPAPGSNEVIVRYHGFDGTLSGDTLMVSSLGMALSPAGDLNGDGFSDALVGAVDGLGFGNVFVLSGAPGGLSLSSFVGIRGSIAKDGWGSALTRAGDLDGDGLDDFAVGAPALGTGSVTAALGRQTTGFKLLPPVNGASQGDRFGATLAPAYPDSGGGGIAVGAPGWPQGGSLGAVFVLAGSPTGLNSEPITRFDNPDPMTKEFGIVLVSTPRGPNRTGSGVVTNGGAYAISARTGPHPNRVAVCLADPTGCDILQTSNGGESLAFLDVGLPLDFLAVGSPDENTGPMDDGGWVGFFNYSAGSWSPRKTVTGLEGPKSRFGAALATGDFQARGTDQLLVGVPGASKAYLFAMEEDLSLSRLAIYDLPGIGAPLALLLLPLRGLGG